MTKWRIWTAPSTPHHLHRWDPRGRTTKTPVNTTIIPDMSLGTKPVEEAMLRTPTSNNEDATAIQDDPKVELKKKKINLLSRYRSPRSLKNPIQSL